MLAISIVLFVVPDNSYLVMFQYYFTCRVSLFRNQNLNISKKYNSVISHCYIILIHRDLSSIEIEIYSSPITLKQTTKPQINSVIQTMNGIIKSNPNKLPKTPVIPL